jgi:hypothetical protein
MKKKHKLFLAAIGVILLSLLSIPVYAQSPEVVQAEVDRNEITTDDLITLSVTINTGYGSASEPRIPKLDDFDVVGTSTSTSMSIINGAVTSEKIFHYTLRPRAAGELIIAPISVNLNGQAYTTAPINVIVSQGTGQMQTPSQSGAPGTPPVPGFPSLPSIPGFPSLSNLLQNFGFDIPMDVQEAIEPLDPAIIPPELNEHDYLVVAEIDNTSPYLGQQVTYTFRYYRPAASAGSSSYMPPEFSGFWVHPDLEESTFGGQIDGRNIRMTEIVTTLTPTVLGDIDIAPAQISNEGDIFTRSFTIQTQPKTITVQPLPQGAPASFSGAVGNFSISAETDFQETMVNDAISLNISITGEGNLDTFADPHWEIGPQWRAFDSQSDTTIESQTGVISGTRTITQVLVPTMWGEFTIPPIQFSYFDPQSETYQTIETDPINVFVEEVAQAADPITMDEQSHQSTSLNQLHPIKNTPETGRVPSLLTEKIGYWLLWLVPLALIVTQYSWQRRKKNVLENPAAHRGNKAAKKAYQALNRLDPQGADYFNVAGRILVTFISDKFNRSVSGLTQAELSGLLLTHGVSEELVDNVRTCITISDMGQYAPIQQVNSNELHQEIKSLISDLDKVL